MYEGVRENIDERVCWILWMKSMVRSVLEGRGFVWGREELVVSNSMGDIWMKEVNGMEVIWGDLWKG